METRAFQPLYQSSNQMTSGTLAPSTVILANAATATPNSAPFSGVMINQIIQIQISNTYSVWAFVNFGVSGSVIAATLNGYPVAPGAVVVVTVGNEVTGASVILAGTPATGGAGVVFTRGEGL
jgi:hypothetical protein